MIKRALSFIWAAAFLAVAAPASSAGKVVERIIARVNSEIITERQFDREKQKLRGQLAQEYSGPELEAKVREQSKNLLRDMIDQDLMVEKAKDLDIKVETDVVKELDQIRQQQHVATLEDLKNEVEKGGLIWEDFEDGLRRNLLMREVIGREVGSRIVISHEETRKYYQTHLRDFVYPEGVHLAEILVSTEKRKPEEAEKRAKDALAEIKAGSRFDLVAKKYSDHESASEGGDIGFFKKGQLAPDLAQSIDKLDVGDMTDVIQTKYGDMILKVVERRKQGQAAFEDVEQKVNEILYNERMQPALREFLSNLRKESYIYLAPGYLDTGVGSPSQAMLQNKGQ